jgi:cobalt-zinc-cadmium efflux system membrane fusion protein
MTLAALVLTVRSTLRSHSEISTMGNFPTAPVHRMLFRTHLTLARARRCAVAASVLLLSSVVFAACGGDDAANGAAGAQGDAVSATNDSVVTLDTTAQRLAGVELLTISSSNSSTLTANGTITFDANLVSVISSRAEGRISEVRTDLGQKVRAGEVLATAQSAEVGATRGDLERARVGVDVARRNFEREKRLFAEQITPQKELLEAEGAFRTAEADFKSAESKLRALGATSGEGASFGLATPVSGTVVERNASPGQVVGPTTNLFTVADLRRVWITVDVYEGDLARVLQGAKVSVVPSALASEAFPGRVTYAGGVVDSSTRTFKVRVDVNNAALRLRPGMFARVDIETPVTGGAGAIVVPEIAVQELGGKQIVFVAQDVPGRYIARAVTLGPRAGQGTVVVATGLQPGDRIAVKGAFQLKAELTKASFGSEE